MLSGLEYSVVLAPPQDRAVAFGAHSQAVSAWTRPCALQLQSASTTRLQHTAAYLELLSQDQPPPSLTTVVWNVRECDASVDKI